MPLHPNNQYLKDVLESLPLLDGRFERIRLINFDAITGEKRGCFSLVFRAFDVLEQKEVALKFYDVDPTWAADRYRLASFARENTILQSLMSVDRCLQLVRPIGTYGLRIPVTGAGLPLTLPCQYFAVEWLDEQIDGYFLEQEKHESVDKLRLFNEIVLAVEALHRRDIFHRDLKADNLRATSNAAKRIVVAIDLGTAARVDSGLIAARYDHPVGAPGYASPEALCGLSGSRKLGKYSDAYALGCLIFELFNKDYFFAAVRQVNSGFDLRLAAMAHLVQLASTDDQRVDEWHRALGAFGSGVNAVRVDGPGNSASPAIAPLLQQVVSALTHVNYRKRLALPFVRQRIWTAITILRNEDEYQRRLAHARELRRLKLARVAAKEQRYSRRLVNRMLKC